MLAVTTLWILWTTRNDSNAGDSVPAATSTADLIQKHYAEFKQNFQKSPQNAEIACSWHRPEGDFLKINIDGSYKEAGNT